MPNDVLSLDDAVARVGAAYRGLQEPLPVLVAHLESLDPAFGRVPTVRALRDLVHAYADRKLLVDGFESDDTARDPAASPQDTSGEWADLVAHATRVVCETHAATTAAAPHEDAVDQTGNTTTNILQLDSFNMWSPDSQLGDDSECEFHQNRSLGREDDADRAMRTVEMYVQQEVPSVHMARDAGSSDSALFPEYRGVGADTSAEESAPANTDSLSRVTAADALQNAAVVLKAHPDWLVQHVQWKAVTCALVHATHIMTSTSNQGETTATTTLKRPSATSTIIDYFHAAGPAQRYLTLSELCTRLRDHATEPATAALVPVALELARQAPDDWLTWLESEVLQLLVDLTESLVLAFPTQCAASDPTAEWMAQWATRPALAVSLAALVDHHTELLEKVARALLHYPTGHLAALVSYWLPAMARCPRKDSHSQSAAAAAVEQQLCDGVVAFVLRTGLPSSPRGDVESRNGVGGAASVCVASLEQLLRTTSGAPLLPTRQAIERWCQETLRIVELQIGGGVHEVALVKLLTLLIPRLDANERSARVLLTHLDRHVAAKLEGSSIDAFTTAAHDLWLKVLPRHWSSLPQVCNRMIEVILGGADAAAASTRGSTPRTCLYSVHHLIAISWDIRGWMWLSARLASSALCVSPSRGLSRFAACVLEAILVGGDVQACENTDSNATQTTIPRLTRRAGVLLLRWCGSCCAPLRKAMLDEARARQLQSAKELYCADGDGNDVLACLDDWLLTVPVEMVSRAPLETSTKIQTLLDTAVLAQSVFLLLLISTDPAVGEAASSLVAPYSGTTIQHLLLSQYARLAAPEINTQNAQPPSPRLSLPFGIDSRALLLRLAVVCRMTHHTTPPCASPSANDGDPVAAAAAEAAHTLIEAVVAQGDCGDEGIDAIALLLHCLRDHGAHNAATLAPCLVPILLSGFYADIDEDVLPHLLTTPPSCQNSEAVQITTPPDGATVAAICASAFPTASLTALVEAVCTEALMAFGDADAASKALSQQATQTWTDAFCFAERVHAAMATLLETNVPLVTTLTTAGADIFTLCQTFVLRTLASPPPRAFIAAVAMGGVSGADTFLASSFSDLVERAMASTTVPLGQAWCIPEDSLLPLPSPLAVIILSHMSLETPPRVRPFCTSR